MNCPICRSDCSHEIARRVPTPVLMHQLYSTQEDAKSCPVGAVDLVRCCNCGFAWNAAFDPDLIEYGPGYDNDQLNSGIFRAHVDEMLERVRAEINAVGRPVCVVEVGAGQGQFLKRLVDLEESNIALALGFDPAFRGSDGTQGGPLHLFRRFYDRGVARDFPHRPDIVISRHTIEHVPDPVSFLQTVKGAIPEGYLTKILLETPDVGWIIENEAFEDVFYEHCSIFDPGSLEIALEEIGCTDTRVDTVFQGQYLWASAQFGWDTTGERKRMPPPQMSSAISIDARMIANWRARLPALAAEGPVVVWGAGAKGMSFCQTLDPDRRLIAALVDINVRKVGRFIGMSGHLVADPTSLPEISPSTIIVTNPNYRDEIVQAVRNFGCTANVIVLHG